MKNLAHTPILIRTVVAIGACVGFFFLVSDLNRQLWMVALTAIAVLDAVLYQENYATSFWHLITGAALVASSDGAPLAVLSAEGLLCWQLLKNTSPSDDGSADQVLKSGVAGSLWLTGAAVAVAQLSGTPELATDAVSVLWLVVFAFKTMSWPILSPAVCIGRLESRAALPTSILLGIVSPVLLISILPIESHEFLAQGLLGLAFFSALGGDPLRALVISGLGISLLVPDFRPLAPIVALLATGGATGVWLLAAVASGAAIFLPSGMQPELVVATLSVLGLAIGFSLKRLAPPTFNRESWASTAVAIIAIGAALWVGVVSADKLFALTPNWTGLVLLGGIVVGRLAAQFVDSVRRLSKKGLPALKFGALLARVPILRFEERRSLIAPEHGQMNSTERLLAFPLSFVESTLAWFIVGAICIWGVFIWSL